MFNAQKQKASRGFFLSLSLFLFVSNFPSFLCYIPDRNVFIEIIDVISTAKLSFQVINISAIVAILVPLSEGWKNEPKLDAENLYFNFTVIINVNAFIVSFRFLDLLILKGFSDLNLIMLRRLQSFGFNRLCWFET